MDTTSISSTRCQGLNHSIRQHNNPAFRNEIIAMKYTLFPPNLFGLAFYRAQFSDLLRNAGTLPVLSVELSECSYLTATSPGDSEPVWFTSNSRISLFLMLSSFGGFLLVSVFYSGQNVPCHAFIQVRVFSHFLPAPNQRRATVMISAGMKH
ncbi:uncharacterized protein EI90DRAFT_3042567, partial [Cantharellus anzutake]|uniref:uncharacterized protein n=1 Tax=Cantharellus anzutake TaxID=1750568 RepID=UPI0019040AC0